jgi:sucrose-6-phosphate hydrolase SacC (GH32 family)
MKNPITALACFCVALTIARTSAAPATAGPNENVFADFEGDTWGAWQVTGNAFGLGPARGTLANQQPVTGFLGRGLVNSYVGGDKSTGTLTSPEFTITMPYLNFLIGGGNHPGKVCISLLIENQVVRSATGVESEQLHWDSWQVSDLRQKKARLQIVDNDTGGWGHLNVDQITFSDHPRVQPGSHDAITQAQAHVAEAAARVTDDPTRPIFHFLAPAQWMNDPNGPIFFGQSYHLYYQHNPFGDGWGHMHWGHARSSDLVHWQHLPIALWPSKERDEDHVFSGCATTNARGQVLVFYTSIGKRSASDYAEQWVAFGDSEAGTFTKYTNNPVLSDKLHGDLKVYDWRDPFLFRDGRATFLVCGGNLNRAKGGQAVVLLYEALHADLLQWKFRGVLFTHPDPSVKNIECPNFFKLGDRWVLIISPHGKVEYFTGDFDSAAGKFTARERGLIDHSGDYYAPNGLEDPRGRRIVWGWIRGFKEGRGWNGCFTVPRIVSMDADGHLRQAPAPELQKLRGPQCTFAGTGIRNATNYLQNLSSDAIEIEAEIDPGDAQSVGLRLRASADGARGITISYDGAALDVAGTKAKLPLPENQKTLQLRVFLDRSVLEVYANERVCTTRVVYPGENDLAVGVFASGGEAKIKSLRAWPLETIWR